MYLRTLVPHPCPHYSYHMHTWDGKTKYGICRSRRATTVHTHTHTRKKRTIHELESCGIEEPSCLISAAEQRATRLATAANSHIAASPKNYAVDYSISHDSDFMFMMVLFFFCPGSKHCLIQNTSQISVTAYSGVSSSCNCLVFQRKQ